MPWTLIGIAISWLAKHFTFEVAKYVGLRALLVGVILSLLPVALFKGFSLILKFVMNYASTYISGQGIEGVMLQMVGIAGYLATALKIPEGISVYLSCLGVSFVLRMIRVK